MPYIIKNTINFKHAKTGETFVHVGYFCHWKYGFVSFGKKEDAKVFDMRFEAIKVKNILNDKRLSIEKI